MDKRHTSPLILIIGPLLLIGVIGSSARVEARAGPIEVQQLNTYTPVPTPTASPLPSLTPTETQIPTFTPTVISTPTATPDSVFELLSQRKLSRSLIYLPTIRRLIERHQYSVDPLLVVAVIAAESGGDPWAVSSARACGAMQVIWKSWYRYSRDEICTSSIANLIVGMWILEHAVANADGDLRYGLAYYNCSEESVHADRCGSKGGLYYADNILDFWMPRIEAIERD